MTITPFLVVNLRGKKDALRVRQRARRVASLLHFGVHEQTCIAAGAFIVACQALSVLLKPRLCFQIEQRQLQIFAIEENTTTPAGHGTACARLAGLLDQPGRPPLYRLSKTLPPQQDTTEELDLGWLVESIEKTSHEGLFDEIVKQNQEVLSLLHDLRLYQGGKEEFIEKPMNPHAA
jgi:hypothetical protein